MDIKSGARKDFLDKAIEEHSNMVFRLAFTHTKNKADSEDVFQEVFTKLFRREADFQTEEHLKAWLIRVTITTSLDLLKSAYKKRTVGLSYDLPAEEQDSFSEGELTQKVKSLPSKYRTVIHLFYYEDMSIAEIAKTLKTKEGTIKSQLSRARNLLKTKLNGGYFDV